MNRDRWTRVAQLYDSALDHPPSERGSFLAQACGGDADLQREVESLFAQEDHVGPLDRPALDGAAELLGGAATLPPGTRLGPYRLDDLIGSGGMGDVYRATDTRLDRIVAVKILPGDLSTDPRFRERFDREAKAIAALSHPHICALYDVGSDRGVDFLVLEYLEGETLAARLERGALPLNEAVQHGADIADALAAAHRSGIVHRDLKPANIVLTRAGVKLLDFGLAKTTMPVVAGERASGTMTANEDLTAHGTILGTFQYMAPEQLEGQAADARTDIFAVGAVVYEMLTGNKAFHGTSHASLIGAILKDEPPAIDNSQPLTPPLLDHVVRRCLAKDRDERWQSAADLGRELKWIAEGRDQSTAPVRQLARWRRQERVAWTAAAGAALLAVALLAFGARLYTSREARDNNVYRATLALPSDIRFAGVPPVARLAISPDGRRLVFVARGTDGAVGLWIRALETTTAQRLPGTEGAWGPFWSPDSRWIGFFTATDRKLKKIDANGGPTITLCDLGASGPAGLGGSWNRDGVILFASDSLKGVHRMSASGGAASPVTTLDAAGGETRHVQPFFLPDGRHFLYLALGRKDESPSEPNGVYVASIDSPERKRLMPGGSNVAYARGHLLFVQRQALMAQLFDARTLELSGQPSPIAGDVNTGGGFGSPFATAGGFSVSESHVIAYNPGEGEPETRLIWFDRTGKQLDPLGEPASYLGVDLSPDGTRAAVTLTDFAVGNDIWLFDLRRRLRTRLTLDGGDLEGHIWSPDGSRIAYRAARDLRMRDISSGREDVLHADDAGRIPTDWSPDGRFILCGALGGRPDADVWVVPVAPAAQPIQFTRTPFRETPGRFSPDGRWIAYASNESGRNETYVAPFPGPGAKTRVSTDGGSDPRWRRDGRELYYVSPDGTLMAAQVGAGSAFNVGAIQALFKARMRGGRYQYDVDAGGQRFLVTTLMSAAATDTIELVINWQSALSRATSGESR